MTKPAFVFEDITPETAPNEYTDHVAALVAEHESRIAAGNATVAGLTIVAPKGVKREKAEDGSDIPGNGAKAILAFQKAANDAGYTARVHNSVETEDGQLAITFKLTKLNGRAGKPRTSADAETETAVETPTAA